ncbi:MAG: CHAT domain-containing protein, partial [Pseudomonadota bacterium]
APEVGLAAGRSASSDSAQSDGSIPPRVDLRKYCSEIEDQKRTGSCVANAVVGALELLQARQGHPRRELSRLFVYFNSRRLHSAEIKDEGTYVHTAMAALIAHGVCEEKLWPLSELTVNDPPTQACYENAQHHGGIEFARMKASVPIEYVLAEGIPAVIGMQYTVRDRSAVAFCRRFYRALAAGHSVDTAVTEGRLGIFQRAGAGERDWGVPVLYLREDEPVRLPPPVAPVRLNLAIAAVALTVLGAWFYLHIYPLLAGGTEALLRDVGLGLGALAGFVALLRWLLGSVWRALPGTEDELPWRRWLRKRGARATVLGLLAFALAMFFTTSSVYVELDDDSVDRFAVDLLATGADGWVATRSLEVTRDAGSPRGGGPSLLRPPLRNFDATLIAPGNRELSPAARLLQPRPWRSVVLRASDLVNLEIRPLRFVGIRLLTDRLRSPEQAAGGITYDLRLRVDDGPWQVVEDLRQGALYLGGPSDLRAAAVAAETPESRRDALRRCLPAQASAAQLDNMMSVWRPENAGFRRFVHSPRLQPGQTLALQVLEVRRTSPAEGGPPTVQRKVVYDNSLAADDLVVGNVSTRCLSYSRNLDIQP